MVQYGISTVRRQAFDPLHPRCPSSSFRDVDDKRLFSRTDCGGSGAGGVLGIEALNTCRSGMLSMLSDIGDICERNRFFAAKGPKPAREKGRCQGTAQIVKSSLQTANGSESDSLTQNNTYNVVSTRHQAPTGLMLTLVDFASTNPDQYDFAGSRSTI